MVGDKYKVVLAKSASFVDKSKSGSARYDARLDAGEYTATLIKNPSGKKGDSNWLLFDGTTFGATHEYVRTVASLIEALP
jgi:hypothetical protein